MCTGFADQGGVDAWAYKGLGEDIPNCAYYLNKKLPIVAYATVQMQSNAIQVAGAAASASPTPTPPPSSATPTPTTPLTPTPATPNTPTTPTPAPVAPTPAPDTTVVPTPAPVAGVTTPEDPVACEAAAAAPANTMALMGPMTQKQTAIWQQAVQQKQELLTQQNSAQAGATRPGIIIFPVPGGNKPIPVDPFDPGGPTYTPRPKLPTFPISTPPISILPVVVGIINICIPKSPKAEDLSKAHNDAKGDRTKPGYGGQCTPDEHDDLKDNQDQVCSEAVGQSCKVGEIDYGKADKFEKCAKARTKVARKCFAGGDANHNEKIDDMMRAYGRCMKGK